MFRLTENPNMLTDREQTIVDNAIAILDQHARRGDFRLESPLQVKDYLRLRHEPLEDEIFSMLWLTSNHKVISLQKLFQGTINGASVYPRVVVKAALANNAAAAIAVHNHPSGDSNPSLADRNLTKRLKEILEIIDVRLIDHMVVGADQMYSFAENGLL